MFRSSVDKKIQEESQKWEFGQKNWEGAEPAAKVLDNVLSLNFLLGRYALLSKPLVGTGKNTRPVNLTSLFILAC